MKKNKPPLTAPVPVNVQWAGRPPLVSATGEKHRAMVSQAPCGSSISPQPAQSGPSSKREAGRDRWRIICVSV